MTESTDWASALAILAAGLVLGTLFIVMLKRKKGSGVAADSRLELEARRDLLVEQLRDDAVDAEERLRLERETAEVLRELDQAGASVAPVAEHRANPAVKGFLWGMASTVALAGLAFYVYVSAEKKPEVGPPQQIQQAAAVPGAQGEGLQQLEEAVRADPDNVNHRIALAKIYFDQENLMGTFEHTKAALARDPNEPRALTYNAIVRIAMGQNDEAKAMLEKSSKIEPKLLDTWVALASVRTTLGDAAGAPAAIDAAIAAHPEQEARLREVLEAIRKRKVETAPPSPHATMDDSVSPVAAPAAMTAAAAAPDASIHLTLSLASSATLKSGIVYVIARSEGASGHPVAVKRVDAQSFPLSVEIGTADAMMGGVFPATVRLEARLDSDGDAGTTETGDPKAIADGVPAGAKLVMRLE